MADEFHFEERLRVQKLASKLRNVGSLDREDIEWLLDSTNKYFILKGLADRDWARNYSEKFLMSLEIEDLKRQLET